MVVAIQKTGSIAIKRIYARKNNNASSLALQIIFDKHIPIKCKNINRQNGEHTLQ
jgi:hypothetical protein